MIELIIKSYFSLFLSISLASIAFFLFGLYCIIKENRQPLPEKDEPEIVDFASTVPAPRDVEAIAGDDVITTQLDLARAYIETNKKQAAKKILEMIMHEGSHSQQEEAKLLLGMI